MLIAKNLVKNKKLNICFADVLWSKKISLCFLLSLHFSHQEQIQTGRFFAVRLKDNSEILTTQYTKLKHSQPNSER